MIETKDLVWTIVVLTRGTKRSLRWEERRGRREEAEIGSRMWSQRYLGAEPRWVFRTRKRTFNSMRVVKGSQWSCCLIKEVMWEKRGKTSNESSGGIDDGLDRRESSYLAPCISALSLLASYFPSFISSRVILSLISPLQWICSLVLKSVCNGSQSKSGRSNNKLELDLKQ